MLLLPFCWLVAEQFVLTQGAKKRRTGKPSVNTLRESCTEQMGEIMQLFPTIMHHLANAQTHILSHVYAYLDGEKDCFLLRAKREQLVQAQTKLASIKGRLIVLEAGLQATINSLETFQLDN